MIEELEKMKRLERMDLVSQIGRELQGRMTYSDIDGYLAGFGVECEGKSPSVNSKWVYTKELLQKVPDETVLDIADELGIEHSLRNTSSISPSDGKYWAVGHFRLFLSHISQFKERTAQLQKALLPYGISAFVAHEDIEPTNEWLVEIERALFSMDAIAAILTPGFNESQWTDHEVGIAVGRGVLVIPIRRGLDPYGFIGRYQALQGIGKSVQQVADAVFEILLRNPKSREPMISALVDLFLFSKDEEEALKRLTNLARGKLSSKHIDKLRANLSTNSSITSFRSVVDGVNGIFRSHNTAELELRNARISTDAEIAF